jgi:hypothetical protein
MEDKKKPPMTPAQRKAASRARQDDQAKDREKASNRARIEALRAGQDDQAKDREKEADRERKASEKYKEADRKRKQHKRKTKRLKEEWPQAPQVIGSLAMEKALEGSYKYADSIRPTCSLGERITLTIHVECFPAPTFLWKKDGQSLCPYVSGGTLLQQKKRIAKAKYSDSDSDSDSDCSNVGMMLDRSLPSDWSNKRLRVDANWNFKRLDYQNAPEFNSMGEYDGELPSKVVLARCADSTLTIKKSELKDLGTYTVEVSNQHGYAEKSFNINFTPTLVKDISCKKVTVESGNTFSLEVEISGGRVVWLKDSYTPVNEKPGRFHVEHHEVTTLKVFRSQEEDSGTYTARVETAAGQVTSSPCVVTVLTAPKPSPSTRSVEETLSYGWQQANNLMCIYCHEICTTSSASLCEFCTSVELGRIRVTFQRKRHTVAHKIGCVNIFSKNKYICSSCQATVNTCRFCNQEQVWKSSGWILQSKMDSLSRLEANLKDAGAPSIWQYNNRERDNRKGRCNCNCGHACNSGYNHTCGREMLGDKDKRESLMKEMDGAHDPANVLIKLELQEKKRWEALPEQEKEHERIVELATQERIRINTERLKEAEKKVKMEH